MLCHPIKQILVLLHHFYNYAHFENILLLHCKRANKVPLVVACCCEDLLMRIHTALSHILLKQVKAHHLYQPGIVQYFFIRNHSRLYQFYCGVGNLNFSPMIKMDSIVLSDYYNTHHFMRCSSLLFCVGWRILICWSSFVELHLILTNNPLPGVKAYKDASIAIMGCGKK